MTEEKEKYEIKDASPTIGKLATALVKAQAEMPAAKFDATNPFLKNKYATLGCVIETARPVLAKHGLAIMQPVISSRNGNIGIRTMVIHESGEFISSEAFMPVIEQKGVSLAQVAGSVISYLRRYSISSMLGIYADEDTDAHDDEADQKKSAKQELDEAFGDKKKEPKDKPTGKSWPAYMVKQLVDQGFVDEPKHAVNILNLFPKLPRNTSAAKTVELVQVYKARREELEPEEAAEIAWKEWSE